jgi:hypothetical protein
LSAARATKRMHVAGSPTYCERYPPRGPGVNDGARAQKADGSRRGRRLWSGRRCASDRLRCEFRRLLDPSVFSTTCNMPCCDRIRRPVTAGTSGVRLPLFRHVPAAPCSARAQLSPCAPIRLLRSASEIRIRMAFATARTSLAGTNNPLSPLRIASRNQTVSVVTIGSPHAAASSSAFRQALAI